MNLPALAGRSVPAPNGSIKERLVIRKQIHPQKENGTIKKTVPR